MNDETKEALVVQWYDRLVDYYRKHKHTCTQQKIVEILKNQYSYSTTQSQISKFLSGQMKCPDLFQLLLVCSVLQINPCTLMTGAETIPEPSIPASQESAAISHGTGTKADYEPYLGIFHCYFFPTLTKQSQRGEMHYAIMEITYDERNGHGYVEFVLHANAIGSARTETQKKYQGTMMVLPNLNICYIILQEECLECSFLTFRRVTSTKQSMLCRLAAVLTTSAGQGRNPTSHRMVMCRDELSDAGIQAIKPHLRMNSKKILISDKNMKDYLQRPDIPPEFRDMLKKNASEDVYYLIREEHLRSLDIPDSSRYIGDLREISYSRKYYKIGDTADTLLFESLYGDDAPEEYFKRGHET